jgi:tetratricopeptide (TPR) repeat protein
MEKIAHILNNSDSRLKILEDLVDKEPTPDLLIELGQLYQAEGKWDQALSLYQHSAASFPEHGDTWLAIGNYYQYFGEWEQSLEAYDKAIQHDPASYLAWQSKGSILRSLGRLDEAMESYEVAIDLDNSQVSGYIAKASLLKDTEQRESAISTLNQAIQANPTSTEGYLYLSQLHSEKNETQQALEVIQQGITLMPGSAEMYAARGEILQQLAFDLKEKLDDSQINDLNAEELQEFQTSNKAELQRIQLLLDEARTDYDQALNIQPINATALIGQGQIAAMEADHKKALEYFKRAVRFNPLMDRVWISIGEYYLQIKDWQEAYDAFLKAMVLSPSNPRARFGLSAAMAGFKLSDSSSAAFSIQNSLFLWDRIINRSGRNPTRTGRLQ